MSASDVNQDFVPESSMSHLPDEPNFTLPPSKFFVGHTDPLTSVALFPDSKMVISGSYDRRIRLWDVGSGKESGEPLRGHKISVSVVAVSPDGTMFVSGGGDGRILIWNTTTRNLAIEPIQAHSNKIDSMSFSPDSTIIASLAGTKIKLWNVRTAKLIMDIESPSHERQIAFSPEGGRIAAVSHMPPDEQMIRIWDAKTGKPAAVSPIAGHTGGLLSVAWFPNGQRLVTASFDRTIRLWISETGCQVGHSLGGQASWMANQVAVSSDGNLIAALCGVDSIRLWNAITLDQIKIVLQHVESVLCMAVSADVRFIAGGCGDNKVCLWNIEGITQRKYDSEPLPTLEAENQQDLAPDSSLSNQLPMNLMYPEVQSSPEHTVSQAVITTHGPLPLEPPTTAKEDADPVASPAEHSHFRKRWRQPLNFWNARKPLSSPQRITEIEPCSDQTENISTNQGQSPAQDVLDEFNRYVMNDIPIRLIYLPTMELVGRNFVKTHFQDRIKEITEDLIAETQARAVPPSTRERVIPTLVWRKVEYGIFSHRWLDTGEPSYQEMTEKKLSRTSNVRHLSSDMMSRLKEGCRALHISRNPSENDVQSPGYKKLQKCCEEARRLDLHFLWSDTCCIDKNSSAELDESIRSMFRWYRNSSICITYLGGTTVIEDLKSEEWFTRGWTLQELLASRKIKFFNKDWQRLTEQDDDKEDDTPLMTVLQEVTGIPESDLIDFWPVPRYIDKRMTWAAQRKTTRAEDVAYSLMGLFDVSLQIAYGEGGERAFGRLIEAIMQGGGDSSVLNWAGAPAKHHASFAIPASPASFVGHPDIVTIGRLDMMLTSRGLRIPLVILPLEMPKPEFINRPVINPNFRCPHHGIGEVRIDSRGYEFSAVLRQYALGIFHYIPAEDSANPGLPKQVAAYLLERREVGAQPDYPLGLSRLYRSFEDGWRRIPTGFIYLELPDVPDFASLWYVSRTCLETVYL